MTQTNDSTKHTPGTWTAKINVTKQPCCGQVASSIGYVTADTGHREIAVLYGAGNGDEQEANARLIAAAPDLLATLKDILDLFEHERDIRLGNGYPEDYAAIKMSRAAIAKAEGREA